MIKENPIIKRCVECNGPLEIIQMKAYANRLSMTKGITGKKKIFLSGAYYQCKDCNFKEYL